MADQPPHDYFPLGPVEDPPFAGFCPEETRAEAFAAVFAGVFLGAHDRREIERRIRTEYDADLRMLASWLWRCRLAGRAEALAGAVTEDTCWAVSVEGLSGLISVTDEGTALRIVNLFQVQGRTAVAYSCTPVPEPPRDVPATEAREDEDRAGSLTPGDAAHAASSGRGGSGQKAAIGPPDPYMRRSHAGNGGGLFFRAVRVGRGIHRSSRGAGSAADARVAAAGSLRNPMPRQ